MSPIQTLQVFNSGKPCGWLGQSKNGYWFHYSSNNPQQYWVSLLMPPSQNFYQHVELFPVFAQYGESLDELHRRNGTQLGTLSFANPDNPVVKQPLRTPPPLLPGQSALIINSQLTQMRRSFADTLVHPEATWPLVQQLQAIKSQADPNNRLHALRWSLHAQPSNGYVHHTRPDMDAYQQQLYGFESVGSVLNLDQWQLLQLEGNTVKYGQVLQEIARTFCKNFSAEIELLNLLLPLLKARSIEVHLAYEQHNSDKPFVRGLDYLPFRLPLSIRPTPLQNSTHPQIVAI